MEIVSEPDLRSAEEAGIYLRKLRSDPALPRHLRWQHGGGLLALRLQCLGAPSGRAARHALRDQEFELGQVRHAAIEYEARRQVALIEEGGAVQQETRLYDSARGETRPSAPRKRYDYRYFPDPDLLPLVLEPEWLDRLRAELPSCPTRRRPVSSPITASRSRTPSARRRARDRRIFREGRPRPRCKGGANWVMGDLFGALNKKGARHRGLARRSDRLGMLIDLIAAGTISGRIAKDIFARCSRPERRLARSSKRKACASSAIRAPSKPPSMQPSPPTRPRSRNTLPTQRSSASSSAR